MRQRPQQRIDKNRQRAEQHHGRDSHRNFRRRGFHYRLGRQYSRSTADTAARTNQPDGIAIQLQQPHAQQAGYQEGAGQGQRINQNAAETDVSNLL